MLSGVKHGVEIDAYTLASSLVALTDSSSVTVGQSGFSVVLLPRSSCPGLLMLTPPVVPTLDKYGRNSTSLQLTLSAPWRAHGPHVTTIVTVTAPGLELSASTISVPGTLTVRVANLHKSLAKPHYFMLTLKGDGILGTTRRWVHAV